MSRYDSKAFLEFGKGMKDLISFFCLQNVKNTKFMFRNAKNFNSDLSKWQLAPDSMEGMFLNAEAFSSDLHGFDVSNVSDRLSHTKSCAFLYRLSNEILSGERLCRRLFRCFFL